MLDKTAAILSGAYKSEWLVLFLNFMGLMFRIGIAGCDLSKITETSTEGE